MPETRVERKQRERQRDAIQALAAVVADHVAGGDMIAVERLDDGEFRFSRPPEGWRCRCGMHMAPFPTFDRRFGVLPTYYCPVCSLPAIVKLMGEIADRMGE